MNGWKLTAIIFIVLFVVETIFLVYAFNLGNSMIENENKCIVNVCGFDATTGLSDISDAFAYDEYNEICYCYKDDVLVKQEYLI